MTLKALLGRRSDALPFVLGLMRALGITANVEDASGELLLGQTSPGASRIPVERNGAAIGWVSGQDPESAATLATALGYLATKEDERRSLAGEVLHLYRELNLIEQLSERLTALPDLTAIGQAALDEARRLIAASSGSILVSTAGGAELRAIATFGQLQGPDGAGPLRAQAEITVARGVAEILNGPQGSVLCAPLRAKQRTVGAILLATQAENGYFTKDLKLLNTIALQTAAAIENSFLYAEMLDSVRTREKLASLQKELETARTIQQSLIPNVFPPFPHRSDFELHAQMTPARSVGGDFFDFFLLDEDRLGIVLGDVSGKGIPAALYMAVTGTRIRTIAKEGGIPEDCLRAVNEALVREQASSMFATCFYGILHTRTGRFECCNAGHNTPLLLRRTGVLEPMAALESGGLPLGLFGGLPYSGGSMTLEAGDTILLYTDGVTEARDPAFDDFTDERLAQVVSAARGLSCRELIDAVGREIGAFAGGAEQSDDITMLALRALGEPQGKRPPA
jgi:serine phosphatase RsbU (regulator of sigma subunit)